MQNGKRYTEGGCYITATGMGGGGGGRNLELTPKGKALQKYDGVFSIVTLFFTLNPKEG